MTAFRRICHDDGGEFRASLLRLSQHAVSGGKGDHVLGVVFRTHSEGVAGGTKPAADVRRLVAGPGVYICDGCVALSATIIADSDARTTAEKPATSRSPQDHSADEILRLLPILAANAARAEADLARWIDRLRAQGVDWPAIADTLGLDAAATRLRFGRDR
ncbi:ClpX C4-type zinc finger protein [Nocardia sp. NPDC020380]|uniref:ClpX C4-type zinc finger protein n=1 Tax=Nocardia sp. NPDC020380 TaxID=3364309 RepID=UPI00378EBF7B